MERVSPPKDSAELVIRRVTPDELQWRRRDDIGENHWESPNGSIYKIEPNEIIWALAPPSKGDECECSKCMESAE